MSELSKLRLNTYRKPPRCPWPWPPWGLWSSWRLEQALQTADGGTWLLQPPALSARFRIGGMRKRYEGKKKWERQHMERQEELIREESTLRLNLSFRQTQRQGGQSLHALFFPNTRKFFHYGIFFTQGIYFPFCFLKQNKPPLLPIGLERSFVVVVICLIASIYLSGCYLF